MLTLPVLISESGRRLMTYYETEGCCGKPSAESSVSESFMQVAKDYTSNRHGLKLFITLES